MAQTEAQKRAKAKYRATTGKGKRTNIVVELTLDDKAEWIAYAQSKDMGNATMIRDCVKRCMAADGWAWDKQGQGDEIPQ